MSCIAGVWRRDGAPVDRAILGPMLGRMEMRAPHGTDLHCAGSVGLGHAFLRTGSSRSEQANELTLDGNAFIAGDCRIDGRGELVALLRTAGRAVDSDTPHALLVLHAYLAFGDAFLDHLIGDFAFAIWDVARQRLVCVRDPFGIRPFYYFASNELFAFASQPDALLAHPGVSAELDDDALAEFLMFGTCLDPSRTVYRRIHCLPRASRMQVVRRGETCSTYWSLPPQEWIRYKSEHDYVERFDALFTQSVRDRLPDGPISLQLSGGMDSTSIAAVAAPAAAGAGHAVTAHHISSGSLAPGDDETALAALAADSLRIRMITRDAASFPLFSGWDSAALRTPLPVATAQLASTADTLRSASACGAHVLLSGYAGDALFAAGANDLRARLRSGRWLGLIHDLVDHYKHTGSLRGSGLRAMVWKSRRADPPWKPSRPDWVAGLPDTVLAEKWRRWWELQIAGGSARAQLSQPWTSRPFEEAEYAPVPVVLRYPFLDIRLIRYLLALPPHLLAGKRVMRAAMASRLPVAVVTRPKTVASVDVVRTLVTNGNIDANFSDMPRVVDSKRYALAWRAYCDGHGSDSTWSSSLIVLPMALRNWILSTRSALHEA